MIAGQISIKNLKDRKETINFILFFMGKLVSVFGSAIYSFAIGLHVLRITGSGLNFAATLVLGTIPMIIVNPFAGVLADKFDKKKLVVWMDILNGVLFIVLYTIIGSYELTLTMIYISTFIMTVFTTIFSVSMEAAKPNIVSEKVLMSINSSSKIIDSVSSILGPMLGGMVFAFMDIKLFILINGISFVFSGISEMFMDFKFNYENSSKIKEKVNFTGDIREGFKYLISRKKLISLFGMFTAINFFLGYSITVPLPFIINNVLKMGSRELGIIQAAFPAGMIIGAVIIKRVIEKVPYNKLLSANCLVMSLAMIAIGLPILLAATDVEVVSYLIYYCVVMTILGISIAFTDIPISYLLQKEVTDEFRGRVLSIGISVAKIILPVALVLSGFLLNRVPPYTITISGGCLLIIVTFFASRR